MAESKIKSLEITNFMSIKQGNVAFDDSNILDLCGYNDSGKSAITRLLEVMFYNAYPADQAKFITDGEEFWKGSLHFTDGVVIDRYKYLDGKSLWEMHKDGVLLFTNKLDNGTIAAMGDTPDVIANYLGVIQDEFTEEKLNVRRNTDKLFLINTTGGDNYKILNSVLQSETLAEASRRLNEDKNKLNSKVTNLKVTQEVLQGQFNAIDVVPDEEIDTLKIVKDRLSEVSGQLARLTMISELRSQLNSMVVFDEVESIDMTALHLLKEIANNFNQLNVPVIAEVEGVDLTRLQALQLIASLRQAQFVAIYDELLPANADNYNSIKEIGSLYNNLYNANLALYNTDQELNKVKKELAQLSQQYNLKVCGNCGSIVA